MLFNEGYILMNSLGLPGNDVVSRGAVDVDHIMANAFMSGCHGEFCPLIFYSLRDADLFGRGVLERH